MAASHGVTFEELAGRWMVRGLSLGAVVGAAVALFADPTGGAVVADVGIGVIVGGMLGLLGSVMAPGAYMR
jgi:hypothetical protein